MSRQNPKAKTYTPDQVAAKQDKAVRFLRNVVGDDDRADDIEDMSLSEYADHKKIEMASNPKRRQRAESRRQQMRGHRLSTGNRQSAIGNPKGDAGNGAARMYEVFHGREPMDVIEYEAELEDNRDLAAIGDLIELDLPAIGRTVNFARDGVVLATNPTGTQLFAVGGDQDLSAALDFAPDPEKEFIDLGPIKTITYRTRKSFDQFQTTDYVHELGEEGGEKPRLVYHAPAKHMIFVGGSYGIAPAESDGVSPGIVN